MKTNKRSIIVIGNKINVDFIVGIIENSTSDILILKAYNCKDGFRLITAKYPDLIICDLDLPDESSYNLSQKVRAEASVSNIPILVLAENTNSREKEQKLLKSGIDSLLSKPFNPIKILIHVNSLLRLKYAEDILRNKKKHHIAASNLELKESHQDQIEIIINHVIEGIWDWNLQTNKITLSDNFKSILDYSSKKVSLIDEEYFLNIIHPDDRDLFLRKVKDCFKQQNSIFESEIRMRHRDGKYKWLFLRGYIICDKNQHPLRIIGIKSDLTSDKKTIKFLEQKALYDTVTKLPNRSLFTDLVKKQLLSSVRKKSKVGIIFIDLDNFKQINDKYGHYFGDQVLSHIAISLSQKMRPLDTIARFAGDEFIMAIPEINDMKILEKLVTRIRDYLSKPFVIDNKKIMIKFSAGLCIFPEDGKSVDQLLNIADKRMYEDKRRRKNNTNSLQ